MPSRFAFTCLVVAGRDTRFERIALVVQRQLFAVGIDMQLRLVSSLGEFRQLITRGDCDAFIFEIGERPNAQVSVPVLALQGAGAADGLFGGRRRARPDDAGANRRRGASGAVSDVMRVFRQDPPAVFLAFPREARAADTSRSRFRTSPTATCSAHSGS